MKKRQKERWQELLQLEQVGEDQEICKETALELNIRKCRGLCQVQRELRGHEQWTQREAGLGAAESRFIPQHAGMEERGTQQNAGPAALSPFVV